MDFVLATYEQVVDNTIMNTPVFYCGEKDQLAQTRSGNGSYFIRKGCYMLTHHINLTNLLDRMI